MKISELIKQLEVVQKNEGDIKVVIDSLSHAFPPDLAVRTRDERVLVLNS